MNKMRLAVTEMESRGLQLTADERATMLRMSDEQITNLEELRELALKLPPDFLASMVCTMLLALHGDVGPAREELFRALNVADVLGCG